MQVKIYLPCSEEELHEALEEAQSSNSGPLRALCRKEVERFEARIKQHAAYHDGLVRIERLAVEGYLYQKLRGHIDAKDSTDNLPEEG